MDKTRNRIVVYALRLFERGMSVSEIQKTMMVLFPKQNKLNIRNLIEKSLKMYCSLNRSIDDAGGSGWDIDTISEMTVLSLITKLGINNIEFRFNKKGDSSMMAQYKIDRYDEVLNEVNLDCICTD